ncbi:MAG: Gfo/Idh/MocA family oxidoreductase [Betaproteobacteria bacterium]|nr:MAG: Gfo/Idh/MocA family oxidoreductase [Betaproteobacteria bacterium]
MTVGWALIGTGQHPRLKMAPAINSAAGCQLAAVMSRDLVRAKQFSAEFAAGSAVPYTDVEDMLRDPRVHVVYVASPNALHVTHVIAAARAGKHVLCEKPMALSVTDCERMIGECERAGVKLGVAFHLRTHPGVLRLRELIQSGSFGTLAFIQTMFSRGTRGEVTPAPRTGSRQWWNDPSMVGAGAMVGTGVHCVDAIRFLTGSDVRHVAALTDADGVHGLEQLALVGLRMTDGTLATVCASRRLPDVSNDLLVCGSFGRATLYDGLDTALKGRLEITTKDITSTATFDNSNVGLYTSMVEAFNAWIAAPATAPRPTRLAGGQDGMAAVQVTSAMLDFVNTGRHVAL